MLWTEIYDRSLQETFISQYYVYNTILQYFYFSEASFL